MAGGICNYQNWPYDEENGEHPTGRTCIYQQDSDFQLTDQKAYVVVNIKGGLYCITTEAEYLILRTPHNWSIFIVFFASRILSRSSLGKHWSGKHVTEFDSREQYGFPQWDMSRCENSSVPHRSLCRACGYRILRNAPAEWGFSGYDDLLDVLTFHPRVSWTTLMALAASELLYSIRLQGQRVVARYWECAVKIDYWLQ